MLDTTWKDLRYAARSLRRAPAFTMTALVTLALGIGANTAIFSLVNAVMLRTLPVAAPEELVFVGHRNPSADDRGVNLLSNPAWLQRIRQEAGIFAGVAAYNIRDFKVVSDDAVEQIVGQYASGNYHSLIGVPMELGRGFTSENDFAPGSSPIAVISDRYWQRRYDRSPDALGSRLVIGGHTVTIVGVTAPGFEGLQPGRSIEITLPLSIRVQDEPDFVTSIDSWTGMPLVARLQPGVTASAAEPVVDRAFREHMTQPGIGFGRARDGRFLLTAAVVPADRGADRLRRDYEPALQVLMVIVAIVLAIACVNVANLFLARGVARADEIAMRLAIGASRWRVVRQLLTEGAIVALGGGLVGYAAAGWATLYVQTLLRGGQRPIAIDVQPDARVLAFTLGVASITTLLFGLAPALFATRVAPNARITATTATTRRSPGRMVLVGAQLAMCVVLVFEAGLFARTLRNLQRVDGRLATDTVLAFAIDANDSGFPLERLATTCTEAIDRLRQPDVMAASCSTMTPLDTAFEIRVLGLPELPPGRDTRDIFANAVTPGYFAAFGIESVRGRLFTAADTPAAPRVAILNEAGARHFFGDRDPIGQHIAFGSRPDPALVMTVIGIVRDVRQQLRVTEAPMAYQPLAQIRFPPDYIVGAIRTASDPAPLGTRVRGVVRSLSPALAVSWIRTLREQMRAALVTERLLASLSLAFGVLAVVLAGIGVYGVIAYDVTRRTREIGIRIALGAQQRTVLIGVFRQIMLIVIPGIAAGVGAGMFASAAIETFLFGITPRDPWTLAAAALMLALIACVAGYVPARRAANVNPALALRAQ
jgi:predicted permease